MPRKVRNSIIHTLRSASLSITQHNFSFFFESLAANALVRKLKILPANVYVYSILFLSSLIYTYPFWANPGLIDTRTSIPIHTRLAYEYFEAWREGQWLPLVMPIVNGGIRIPVFQYYCATGYILPALLMALGLAPYPAIIVNTIFWSFAGPAAFYHIFKRFGASSAAAAICAVLFLFYPDLIAVLYGSGLYAEWLAVFALPVVAWALFRLVEPDSSGLGYKIRMMVASLLVGFYLPFHPMHAFFSYNLVLVLVCVHAYAQRCTKSILYILLSAFAGGLVAAWYWLPIAQDLSELGNTAELTSVHSTGAQLHDLLSPVFLPLGDWDSGNNTPQVGLYFFVLSLLTVIFQRKITIGVTAALIFISVVVLMTQFRDYGFFHSMFFFIDWDYQLLMPLGIFGAIVTVDFILFLQRRRYRRWYAALLSILVVCAIAGAWQYSIGIIYRLKAMHQYDASVMERISNKNFNYNTGEFNHFGLHGTDFQQLDFTQADFASRHYSMQQQGIRNQAYILTLKLHAVDKGNQPCPLKMILNQKEIPQTCAAAGNNHYILSGTTEHSFSDLAFTKNIQSAITVEDFTIRSTMDGEDKSFRILPKEAIRSPVKGGITLTVTIPPGKAGLYQLPIFYWPGLGITVNGAPTTHQSSDLLMAVVSLQEGKNIITLTNRWTLAKSVSVIGLLLALSFLRINTEWLEHKLQSLAEPPVLYLRGCIKQYLAYTRRFVRLSATRFFENEQTIRAIRSIWFEAAMISILPCLLLFNIGNVFGPDWHDHAWMTAYTSAYLQDHFAFPRVLNTQGSIGSAVTIFSGYGTYYVLGLLGIIFHPHVTILIVAYTLYCLQYGSLALLLARMNLPHWFASMTAAIVTFAIYPLTNLYNRGDTPEFFATTALTIGIVALLLSIISENPGQRQRWYAITLMAFGFMATGHSLTLLNAAIFMAFFCPLLLWMCREQFWKMFFAMTGILVVVVLLLSPFLYAYYSVEGKIKVSMDDPTFIAVLSDHIDMVAARLWPLLFPINADVPYLEAPANMCLLVMSLLLVVYAVRQCGFRTRLTKFVAIMTTLLLLYFWCTLSRYPWEHLLPLALRANQYVYRLVTMINLIALCLLLGVGLWLKDRNIKVAFPPYIRTLTIVICTVAACAFSQKMTHAFVTRHPGEATLFLTDEYLQPLLNERGHNAYATPTFFEEVSATGEKPQIFAMDFDSYGYVSLGSRPMSYSIRRYGTSINSLCQNNTINTYGISDLYAIQPMPVMHNFTKDIKFNSMLYPFGDVPPVQVHVDKNGWYVTNATVFIWSSISVDGKVLAAPLRHAFLYSVYLTPGDHEIAYAFRPPLPWVILNYVAFITSIVLILYFLLPILQPAIGGRINRLFVIR